MVSGNFFMGSIFQYIFSTLPSVIKPKKVTKIDVVIDRNVSDVVTGEDGIERIYYYLHAHAFSIETNTHGD